MNVKNLEKVGCVKDWPIEIRTSKCATVAHFLRYTVEEYAKFNAMCYRATGSYDFPLCYGEWENQPIVWYSMRSVKKYTATPLAEQFYQRRLRGEERKFKNQRLDYLVVLNDKDVETVLWIEYKHRVVYLDRRGHGQKPTDHTLIGLKAIAEDWAHDEVKLSNMASNKYPDLWGFSGRRKPVKVNFLIMPICQRAKTKAKGNVENDRRGDLLSWVDEVRKILEKGDKEKKPHVNWEAVWVLDPELRQRIEWKDDDGNDWSDYYHGVFFFAYLWSD